MPESNQTNNINHNRSFKNMNSRNQGAASNYNGIALQKTVQEILDNANINYKSQIKKYKGINPNGHKHDFVAKIKGKYTVIECKSFGEYSGSIWEKLVYTINVLNSHNIPCMLVLGGRIPNDWRLAYLLSLVTPKVKVLTVEQFKCLV